MRIKKLAVGVSVTLVLAVVVVSGARVIANYKYRDHGHFYVPEQYAKLKLPPALHYSSTEWDDTNIWDASIASHWRYNYSLPDGANYQEVELALLSTLQRQGYNVHNISANNIPATYILSADDADLSLRVQIGYVCNSQDDTPCSSLAPGDGVQIDATLPANKTHLLF